MGGGSLSRRFDGSPTNLPLAETGRRGSTGVERATAGSSCSESKGGGIPTGLMITPDFRRSRENGRAAPHDRSLRSSSCAHCFFFATLLTACCLLLLLFVQIECGCTIRASDRRRCVYLADSCGGRLGWSRVGHLVSTRWPVGAPGFGLPAKWCRLVHLGFTLVVDVEPNLNLA